jgi:hypothetical protein
MSKQEVQIIPILMVPPFFLVHLPVQQDALLIKCSMELMAIK